MLMVGQKVRRRPEFGAREEKNGQKPLMEGYVLYVHPKGWYHVVAFLTKGGVIREGFQGVTA